MKYLSALLCLSVIAIAAGAEFGYYVPKAFYTIDENGYKSPLIYIDSIPQVFQRARRSAQIKPEGNFPFGAPPGFGFPNPPFGGFGPGFGAGFSGVSSVSQISSSSGGGLSSRFGDDGPVVQGQTHTISTNNGQFTATSQKLGPDGKVTYNVQKGKL